jgi:superfamily II DNA/RNA helicase
VDRHVLKGQAILLVEEQEQPDTARNLQSALERFGTEVVPPQRAVEAIERLEEFDFSLASLDWSPDSSEHSAVARRLKEEGARFLFCPKQLPEEVPTRRGASSSQRPPHPRRSSNPPRSLPTRRNRSKRCAWGMARIRQEPRSTGQAYAARVGICAVLLNVRGKWGSATRGAKDRIVDVLAFASDLGWCAIAGFKWRLPLFGPRIRQDLFVNK